MWPCARGICSLRSLEEGSKTSRLKDAVEHKLGVATGNPGVFAFSVGYGLGLSPSGDKQAPNSLPYPPCIFTLQQQDWTSHHFPPLGPY